MHENNSYQVTIVDMSTSIQLLSYQSRYEHENTATELPEQLRAREYHYPVTSVVICKCTSTLHLGQNLSQKVVWPTRFCTGPYTEYQLYWRHTI